MSKRRKIVVSLVCLVALAGLICPFFRDSEPRYRDVPLSQWLVLEKAYKFRNRGWYYHPERFRSTPFQEVPGLVTSGPEAPEAIRNIGTNAIPWLIKWMSAPRNSWKTGIGKSIVKLPRAVRPAKLPVWFTPEKDYEQASLAYRGFVVLGTEAAATAIPELTKLACDSRAIGAGNAVDVLAGLDPPAVPELVRVLTSNASKDVRDRVLARLGCRLATFSWSRALFLGSVEGPVIWSVEGPDKEPGAWSAAVRDLVTCLKNPDEQVAAWSATALGRIRPPPELAIPALIAVLGDSRPQVRLAAVKALGDFGSAAATATPGLKVLLGKPDMALGEETERALLKINPSRGTNSWETEFIPSQDNSAGGAPRFP